MTLWDVDSRTRKGPPISAVNGAAIEFSPDSKTLLVIKPGEPECRFYDTANAQPLERTLRIEPAHTPHARFSRDGRTIITGNASGVVRLWDAASGKSLGKPIVSSSPVWDIAVSPDAAGDTLLIGYRNGSYRFWDRATCRPIGPPMWHNAELSASAFTPDGRAILTGAKNGSLRSWPTPSALPPPSSELNDPTDNDFELVRTRLEVRTGLTLRGETAEQLTPNEWRLRSERLGHIDGK